MIESSIGDRELALLKHIDEHGDSSVGEAAIDFGEPLGLVRSTVLTMMERLRSKGFLKRRRVRGVYRYRIATTPREVMRHAVDRFVENTLDGSVSPFVAWLAESGKVTDAEYAELKSLVVKLDPRSKGK